jgi:predicted Rossmann-fold nucleotide-binding protein
MSANGRDWRRSCIAVIGDAQVKPDSQQEILAYAVGKELVNAGYRLVTGGISWFE